MTRHVFITGFPGFIARNLLKKLLAVDTEVTVTALVEAGREQEAKEALYGVDQHDTGDLAASVRVATVVGDVTAMDLGLAGAEFRAITSRTTEIYHLAAVHAVAADRSIAERVNVRGTANVLAIAEATTQLERFVHFSSAYVSGDRTGVILEDELEEGQSFKNAYEATKYQAEVLVERAKKRVPCTVIRPGAVVGDSRTGAIDRFDSVYQLAMMLVASPVSVPIPLKGDGRAPMNLVPVDYVVDAVHAIVSSPASIGCTYHVVDPNPLPARRVYELVAERAGKPLPKRTVSPNLTKALLKIPGLEKLASVHGEAIDYLNQMAFYNSAQTAELLVGTGIRCPPFSDYLENLMSYARDRTTR